MKRILAIVFLFNPDIEQLLKSIYSYIYSIDNLIVWNNTPNISTDEVKKIFCEKDFYKKLIFLGKGYNSGLSVAMNDARSYALENHYDYLLTMDQDSIWKNFNKYLAAMDEIEIVDSIFIPQINAKNSSNEIEKIDVPYTSLINSGTLYSIGALLRLGSFDNNLFVEGIDTEIGLRCAIKKISIYCVKNGIIIQTYSSPKKHRLLGFKFESRNTSISRIKGIVASNVYLFYKYPVYRTQIVKHFNDIYGIHYLIKLLLFENNKIRKIKEYLIGFKYGYEIWTHREQR